MSLKINPDRLWGYIEILAAMTESDRPWTRKAFSEQHLDARQWLQTEMAAIGLEVSIDNGANLRGLLPGKRADLAPISSGSHSDTVPRGGRFDGIAGVVASMEVAATLAEAQKNGDLVMNHPFMAIDFLAEEPNDYGVSCIGSRIMEGKLTAEMLENRAPDGSTLAEGINRMGGNAADLAAARAKDGEHAGFIELHIEQGPVLEAENLDVGIVTDIVGITRINFELRGQAAHSGTTPMNRRRDAMVGAAQIVNCVHEQANLWLEHPDYLVGTVGKLEVTPNGSNVVPGKVNFVLEIRSNNDATASRFADLIISMADDIAAELDLEIDRELVSQSPAVECHTPVLQAIENAVADTEVKAIRISSGAGHDAAHMAKITHSGMIFIPCLDGKSHCPEEWADPEVLAKGTQVLLDSILQLDQLLTPAE